MGRFEKYFEDYYRRISEDIFAFCEAVNFQPTHQQAELLMAVQQGHSRIAVRSGQGPGKTRTSVVVGLFRLLRPWSKLVVTAPTMRQCKDVWLAEAELVVRGADPIIQKIYNITNTNIGVCGQKAKNWGCILVTATKPENAQGQHRKDMDVIVEEASGVAREIIDQYKGTLSNPNALFLQVGNPNTRDCAFFDCFHSQAHTWKGIHWNAEETPASEWFSPQRNKELEEEYGRNSDVYRVRVLGEFPHTDPNCVLSEEELEICFDKDRMRAAVLAQPGVKQFGLDFARYGGDENTIFRRSGNAIVEWGFYPHTDPSQCIDHAFAMQRGASWKDKETVYVADAGGIGQGVMHRFYEAGKRVMEFHNNGKALQTQEYENKITEAWFGLAQKIRSGEPVYIARDHILTKQLTSRRYYMTKKGKLVLETKDEYMRRGNDSPDRADGCVMAYYDEILASGHLGTQPPSQRRGIISQVARG